MYKFTDEERKTIEEARRKNRNKNVEKRLLALSLRASGMSSKQVAEKVGFHPAYITELISKFRKGGIGALVENHYPGNRRNLTFAEEEELLRPFKEQAEAGQLVSVSEIAEAYVEKVGHSIGSGQIYRVLKRHGWRKVMPRGQHPKKANEEAIEASKKLTRMSKS